MPARAEPTAKVKEMVLLTLTPIRRAASMSSETARMALPSLVRWTSSVSTIIEMTMTARVRMVVRLMLTVPIWNTWLVK